MKVAMILAAGRGERLRPLTDTCPKALCPLNHIPLIDYHIANLVAAGFERVVVNHAHLGGKIRQHLSQKKVPLDMIFSPEPPGGLETGGGIFNALPLLGKDPFVTINADIYTEYNFATMPSPQETTLAHIILIKKPADMLHSDFGFTKPFVTNHNKKYTFSGIACYRPELFEQYGPGRYSMGPILRHLADKQQLSGEIDSGVWFDIGSPDKLLRANRHFQSENRSNEQKP